jgi:hypothetical protein
MRRWPGENPAIVVLSPSLKAIPRRDCEMAPSKRRRGAGPKLPSSTFAEHRGTNESVNRSFFRDSIFCHEEIRKTSTQDRRQIRHNRAPTIAIFRRTRSKFMGPRDSRIRRQRRGRNRAFDSSVPSGGPRGGIGGVCGRGWRGSSGRATASRRTPRLRRNSPVAGLLSAR